MAFPAAPSSRPTLNFENDDCEQLAFDPLWLAIQQGNIPQIEDLVSRNPALINRPVKDIDDLPPLSWSIKFSQLDVADFFITKGANIDTLDLKGRSAYFYALEKKFHIWADKLKPEKELPLLSDLPYPLHSGVELGDLARFKAFLLVEERFADSSIKLDSRDPIQKTFLHVAVLTGRFSFIDWARQKLTPIQKGYLFECRDNTGWTALHYAVDRRSLRLCQALLALSPQNLGIEKECRLLAQKKNYTEIVDFLKAPPAERAALLQKRQPSAPPVLATPPSQVYQADSTSSARYAPEQDEIKSSQAQPPQRASHDSPSQISNASAAAAPPSSRVSAEDESGLIISLQPLAPFYRAIRGGDLAQVQALILKEPGLATCPIKGMHPLAIAILFNQLDIADFLSSSNSLYFAIREGDLPKVQNLILESPGATIKGIWPLTLAIKGIRPLSLAILFSQLDIADFLVSQGDHIQAANSDGTHTYTYTTKKKFFMWERLQAKSLPPNLRMLPYPLHTCVEIGDIEKFESLGTSHPILPWESQDVEGRTFLHLAVLMGRPGFIDWARNTFNEAKRQHLLECRDRYHLTPLHYAVKRRSLLLCQKLAAFSPHNTQFEKECLDWARQKKYTELVVFFQTHLEQKNNPQSLRASRSSQAALPPTNILPSSAGGAGIILGATHLRDCPSQKTNSAAAACTCPIRMQTPPVQAWARSLADSPLADDCPIEVSYMEDDNSPLHVAIQTGDLNTIKRLVDEGLLKTQPNHEHINKTPPLCLAIRLGYLDIADYLINQEVDITLTDAENRSALYYAAQNGFAALYSKIRSLTYSRQRQIPPRSFDQQDEALLDASHYRKSLFYFLSGEGHIMLNLLQTITEKEGIHKLFKQWDTTRQVPPCDRSSTLHLAVECNNLSVCGVFLIEDRRDADGMTRQLARLKAVDRYNRTPIHIAVQAGRFQFFELLSAFMQDLRPEEKKSLQAVLLSRDDKGWTALHYAVDKGSLELCKRLLSMMGDITLINDATDKQNPLALSLSKKRPDITDFLIGHLCEHFADPLKNTKKMNLLRERDSQKKTLLHHIAVQANSTPYMEKIAPHFYALSPGDGPVRKIMTLRDKVPNKERWTALHYAVNQNNLELCHILVKMYDEVSIIHYPTKETSPYALSADKEDPAIEYLFRDLLADDFDTSPEGQHLALYPPPPKKVLRCPIHTCSVSPNWGCDCGPPNRMEVWAAWQPGFYS
jgi:ankyrin repeat protein